ncbi:MAG: hypothetical protein OQJ84_04410 [Xanthomonadales bacterium]|nr:hypothetical protein [Xanthomonadales bacterium]
MSFFRLLPVFLSFLLLAAHFFRAGQTVMAAIPLLLLIPLASRKIWVPWLIQLALLLGAIEWVRTLYVVAQLRIEYGQPWHRMAIILGAVALFTALSCLVFRSKGLRNRYSEGE